MDQIHTKHAFKIGIGIMMLALMHAGVSSAAIITVNASGGADYTRIYDAVNATNDGDTIIVAPGTYIENIKVGKSVSLIGSSSGVTIVNALNQNDHVFNITVNSVNISGFTVTGATGWNYAGIYLNRVNYINISNNTVTSSYNGINLQYSSNNNLRENTVTSNKENGIYLYYSDNNMLNGNNVSKSGYCGIVLSPSSSNNTLIGNRMSANKYNFVLDSYLLQDSYSGNHNQIDTSNLVDGKPIYLIIGAVDTVYDSSTNAGTFYCINCVNVTIKDMNFNKNSGGLVFWNTTYSKIQNVRADNNRDYGIYLAYSNNNILTNNTASNSMFGIYLSSSSNNIIDKNYALNNNIWLWSEAFGIILVNSHNNTLSYNVASDNGYYSGGGINLGGSNNNTLNGNIASNNKGINEPFGIKVAGSNNNTLLNNSMNGNKYNFRLNGNSASDFDNKINTSNLVDGKPIYLIIGAVDTVYDSSTNAGTFYCINCVNVTIKDMNLNKNYAGIFFWNTTNSKIQNISTLGNVRSIYLYGSNNNVVRAVNASNSRIGIFLGYSNNNTVNNSNFSNNRGIDNGYGVYLTHSNNNTLLRNIASDNDGGVTLEFSNNNTLNSNNVSKNTRSSYGYGIEIRLSSNNIIKGNEVLSNFICGIIAAGSNNSLSSNIIESNGFCGISVGITQIIYNNIFNNTNNLIVNSYDSNILNKTKEECTNIIDGPYLGGNFWAYPNGTGFSQTCTDEDRDGICDVPYVLNANNIDYLPLTTPPILPAVRFINGTVIDSVNKTSIAGVTVSANSTLSTMTNATGFYSFAVTNGTYDLMATLDIRYYTNTTTVSTIGKAVAWQDIELIKKPTGNITGNVRCC